MKFLKTDAWKGYTKKANRDGQTEIRDYADQVVNSTSQRAGKPIAGAIEMGTVTYTFEEDASVPAIRQKCIDMEEIPTIVIEDVQGDKAGTVLRRLTLEKVHVIEVVTAIDAQGDGLTTVKLHCQKAKWERRTPDKTYAEAIWSPDAA
jgi:type VI protein secretion system component Hcp